MKQQTVMALVTFITLGSLKAQQIPFQPGDFEQSPEVSWSGSTSGIASTSFPDSGGNTFGRIAPMTGSGSLTATVPTGFLPNSLYEVSLDISNSNFLALSTTFGLQVLDGGNAVVAELDETRMAGLLGLDLSLGNTLALDLTSLTGALTDQELFLGTLRDLLQSLTENGAVLTEIQSLINSLAGSNEGLLTIVVGLLEDVLSGELDPGSLTDQDLANLLGLDIIDPIVAALSDILAALAGNEDPVSAVTNLLTALLGNPGDLALVDDLLTTLLGESDLLGEVTNLLNLSLVEDVLGTLTGGDTLSLLGILDPGESGFQHVRLLFVTSANPPAGNIGIRLHAQAALGLVNVDFDNVKVRRFNLVATPDPTSTRLSLRPVVKPERPGKIRRTNRPTVKIRGTAQAFGQDNSIRKVAVALRGKGTTPSQRRFKVVRGKETWVARVKVPEGARTRLLFRAQDTDGRFSTNRRVRVSRR